MATRSDFAPQFAAAAPVRDRRPRHVPGARCVCTWWWQAGRRYFAASEPAMWWIIAAVGIEMIHSMVEFPLWSTHFLGVTALLMGLGARPGTDSRTASRLTYAAVAGTCVALALAMAMLLRDYVRQNAQQHRNQFDAGQRHRYGARRRGNALVNAGPDRAAGRILDHPGRVIRCGRAVREAEDERTHNTILSRRIPLSCVGPFFSRSTARQPQRAGCWHRPYKHFLSGAARPSGYCQRRSLRTQTRSSLCWLLLAMQTRKAATECAPSSAERLAREQARLGRIRCDVALAMKNAA